MYFRTAITTARDEQEAIRYKLRNIQLNNENVFDGLEPAGLWRHFAAITNIPRPSGSEGQIAGFVRSWANSHHFTVVEDDAGNVCVRVPATKGCENAQPVVLQGHLDMVCEKDADSPYDAEQGRIHVVRDGEWIRADGTTLGADDGIGVSAMMHAAEATSIAHGPLDLLFTVDEERGLVGADRLDPSLVRGRLLLNLDAEHEGALFVGCAGLSQPNLSWTVKPEPTSSGHVRLQLSLFGLRGGHSGVDIIEDRLNAIRTMARLLDRGAEAATLRVVSISGGKQFNAIPHECQAIVMCPADQREAFTRAVDEELQHLLDQYRGRETNLQFKRVELSDAAGVPSWSFAETRRLLSLLLAIPSGVISMSQKIPGLVETSNNLGVITTSADTVNVECLIRSASIPAINEVVGTLRAIARLSGVSFTAAAGKGAWEADMSSPLLAATSETYGRLFGAAPKITAIHGGLECGAIGGRIPGIDMVSIGADIRDPHSTHERVRIPSVAKFWRLLVGVLDVLSA